MKVLVILFLVMSVHLVVQLADAFINSGVQPCEDFACVL